MSDRDLPRPRGLLDPLDQRAFDPEPTSIGSRPIDRARNVRVTSNSGIVYIVLLCNEGKIERIGGVYGEESDAEAAKTGIENAELWGDGDEHIQIVKREVEA